MEECYVFNAFRQELLAQLPKYNSHVACAIVSENYSLYFIVDNRQSNIL